MKMIDNKKKGEENLGDSNEEIKEHFPSIYREIKENEKLLEEKELRTSSGIKKVRKFSSYTPSILDFICRCKTEEEAIEIIDFSLNKKVITKEYAESLKKRLEEEGLESFGEHRAAGYYEKA